MALPIVVVAVLAIVQVAIAMRDEIAVELAAREGARAAAVTTDMSGAATAAAASRRRPADRGEHVERRHVRHRVGHLRRSDRRRDHRPVHRPDHAPRERHDGARAAMIDHCATASCRDEHARRARADPPPGPGRRLGGGLRDRRVPDVDPRADHRRRRLHPLLHPRADRGDRQPLLRRRRPTRPAHDRPTRWSDHRSGSSPRRPTAPNCSRTSTGRCRSPRSPTPRSGSGRRPAGRSTDADRSVGSAASPARSVVELALLGRPGPSTGPLVGDLVAGPLFLLERRLLLDEPIEAAQSDRIECRRRRSRPARHSPAPGRACSRGTGSWSMRSNTSAKARSMPLPDSHRLTARTPGRVDQPALTGQRHQFGGHRRVTPALIALADGGGGLAFVAERARSRASTCRRRSPRGTSASGCPTA